MCINCIISYNQLPNNLFCTSRDLSLPASSFAELGKLESSWRNRKDDQTTRNQPSIYYIFSLLIISI